MGKGRLFSDSSNDEVYQSETNNENYALSSQQNAQGLGGGVFNDQSGYGNFQQSGKDQRFAELTGALFRGNLGFILNTAELDVTTSTLNLLEDEDSTPLPQVSIDKIVRLSTGDAADLITILGGQRPGQRLRLYNITTNTITIKNTGSAIEDTIFTPGGDDFILTGNEVVDLTYDINNEVGTSKWRVVGGSGIPPPGVSYPILYPKQDFTVGNITQTIDLSIETGNAKQITLTGDIGLAIVGDPANTVGEDVYVLFIQDMTGGWELTEVDSRIKNGGLMDDLLDKAENARTLFRLSTLDGGDTYFASLVDLSTAAGGLLSTLAIDTDKDWAGRFITNLAGISLFANGVANSVNFADHISFISDLNASRGQVGRSEFFSGSYPQGLGNNITDNDNWTVSVDTNPVIQLDATVTNSFFVNSAKTPFGTRFEVNSTEVKIFSPLDFIPSVDGTQNLGVSTFSWNDVNADRLILRHNDGILTDFPSIGRSSNALRLNSPTGNNITLEVAGAENFIVDNLGAQLPSLKRLQFNSANPGTISKLDGLPFQFISEDGVQLSQPGTLAQMELTQIGRASCRERV